MSGGSLWFKGSFDAAASTGWGHDVDGAWPLAVKAMIMSKSLLILRNHRGRTWLSESSSVCVCRFVDALESMGGPEQSPTKLRPMSEQDLLKVAKAYRPPAWHASQYTRSRAARSVCPST